MKEISGAELGGLLFGIHTHAALINNPCEIVYREQDILKLLGKLGFPMPVWGKCINLDKYEPNLPNESEVST